MTTTTSRRRSTSIAAAILSATLVLAACGDDDAGDAATTTTAAVRAPTTTTATTTTAATPRTVKADNGTITVPANPTRVAAIGNTSLPFIDLGGKPVAVTTLSASSLSVVPADQKAIYDAATNVGPSGGETSLEKLASLKPDVILAQMPKTDFDKIAAQLTAIAPTAYFGLGTEWKALADALATAGNLTGGLNNQKKAYEDRIAGIKKTYSKVITDTSFAALDRYSSSDPGTFVVTYIGCVEIAQVDIGMNLPPHPAGNNGEKLSFEQIGSLSKYNVLLYPVGATGQPTEAFAPVVATNAWKALPAVTSGKALGVFCPGNNSYGAVVRYLESLDKALATLPK